MAAVPKSVHVGLKMWKPAFVCQHGALARTFWLKNHDLLQSHTAFLVLLCLAQGPGIRLCLEQGPKYADGGCLAQGPCRCDGGRAR